MENGIWQIVMTPVGEKNNSYFVGFNTFLVPPNLDTGVRYMLVFKRNM